VDCRSHLCRDGRRLPEGGTLLEGKLLLFLQLFAVLHPDIIGVVIIQKILQAILLLLGSLDLKFPGHLDLLLLLKEGILVAFIT